MSLIEASQVDPLLFALVEVHADAIEHAMHDGRLTDLGLRTDEQVRAQIEVSLTQAVKRAGPGPRAMAALAAADYVDDPSSFIPRRRAALWRSCQLHGCEDVYWQLCGVQPPPVPTVRAHPDVVGVLDEYTGAGVDGAP